VREVDELKRALEREYPYPDDNTADWDEVVRRAAAPSPRGRGRAMVLALAGATAVAVAVALIAPWRTESSILDRAAAAIGNGPVIHVVLRADTKAARVDLATGRSHPVYETQEFWWDPARGFHEINRFDGSRYVDHLSEKLPAPDQDPIPLGFASGYRKALESGRAQVLRDGEIVGHEVTWIRFYLGGRGPDYPTFDVAVDRETGKPVFVRYTVGGDRTIAFARAVIAAGSLPAGQGDFAPRPVPPRERVSLMGGGFGFLGRVSASRAASILGRPPLWLGASSGGLSFSGFHPEVRIAANTTFYSPGGAPLPAKKVPKRLNFGIGAFYGPAAQPLSRNPWAQIAQYSSLKFKTGFMEPNEDKIWRTARRGSVLVYSNGDVTAAVGGGKAVRGYLRKDGLYVKIAAPTAKQVVAAAKALRSVG
jgi:hypothetical protein